MPRTRTPRIGPVDEPCSRSQYFVDKGTERGLTAESAHDFERWINTKYAKQVGKQPIVVVMVVGIETTPYARNIYQYHVSYRMTLNAHTQLEKAKRKCGTVARRLVFRTAA